MSRVLRQWLVVPEGDVPNQLFNILAIGTAVCAMFHRNFCQHPTHCRSLSKLRDRPDRDRR